MASREYVVTLYANASAKIRELLQPHATEEQRASMHTHSRIGGSSPDRALLYSAALAEQVAVLADVVDQQAQQITELQAAVKKAGK